MLTVLMTSHYLRSKWCRDEREWWCGKHHADPLGTAGRTLVCRVWPTEHEGWPVEFCDERGVPLPGYHCYERNKHPDKARPFAWRGYTRDRDDYIDLLVELSGDVMQRLRAIGTELERRRKHEAATARLAADGGQVIYLHAREAHAKVWESASDRLEQNGFVVLPSEPDPIAREPKAIREIAERRVETMSGCDGVLLLGTKDGRALDADLVVVGRQDRTRRAHNRPAPAVRRARYRRCRDRHGEAQGNGARAWDRLDRRWVRSLAQRAEELAERGKRSDGASVMAIEATAPFDAAFEVELPPAPYPGLRPFEKHEWPIFFGREPITDGVIRRLIRQHLVVVHGDSGCGKTSLIRAGVLAQLEQEHARSAVRWRTCAMLPREAPLRNLAVALAKLDADLPIEIAFARSAAASTSGATRRQRSLNCSAAARTTTSVS